MTTEWRPFDIQLFKRGVMVGNALHSESLASPYLDDLYFE